MAVEDASDFDEVLYEEMREKRAQLARVRGGLPPYTIFSNKVLRSLAIVKPRNKEEAMTISGIGEAKARKVLPAFLRIIEAYLDSKSRNSGVN